MIKKRADDKFINYKRFTRGKIVYYLKPGTPGDIVEQEKFIDKCLGNHTHIKTYIEVKSHNPNHVPELEKALKLCRARRADLVATRLGSRLYNFKIIGMLMDAYEDKEVRLIACDALGGDYVDLNTLAGAAEARRQEITEKAKKTFSKMKAQGIKLGGPNAGKSLHKNNAKNNQERFKKFAREMQPIFKQIQMHGSNTLKEIADALNARGIPSRHGGKWYPSSVRNVRNKIKELKS